MGSAVRCSFRVNVYRARAVYAICCPYCAYAEVMEHIDQPSCCCEVGFCNSLLCVMTGGFISYILQTVMYSTGIGAGGAWAVNFTPCITCEARQALGKKYSLPTNDCCCPCAAHYFCQGCSIYQESVYVKHVLKKDMNCCCYVNCCRGSKPGDFKGKILANQGNGVISTQPHSNV